MESLLRALLAEPAFWDEGVEAARNACVAGAPLAAAAISAAAYYDNPLTGGRALLALMQRLEGAALSRDAWQTLLLPEIHPDTGDGDFVPGFGYVSAEGAAAVLEGARTLSRALRGPKLTFFVEHAAALQRVSGALNATGLCALAFSDAGLDRDEAERRFFMLRLEPALHAAQRAKRAGLARFPFFEHGYAYEGAWPAAHGVDSELELAAIKKAVGLDD